MIRSYAHYTKIRTPAFPKVPTYATEVGIRHIWRVHEQGRDLRPYPSFNTLRPITMRCTSLVPS